MKLSKHPFVPKRKYHVYHLGSKFLSIAQIEILKKQSVLKSHTDSMYQKQTTISGFMKRTKSFPNLLQQLDEVETSLDACINLKLLCDQAYELGKKVREENIQHLPKEMKISEYLYDFVCLTNENYPCYRNDDLEKIKKLLS